VRRVRAQADQRQAEERAVAKKRNERTREDMIQDAVQVFIESEADGEDEAEELMDDLSDMVEDGLATKLAHLPISGAIAHLCRDLGVTPDWDEVAGERWAYEEARDGVPGSPFVERRRRRARERAARGPGQGSKLEAGLAQPRPGCDRRPAAGRRGRAGWTGAGLGFLTRLGRPHACPGPLFAPSVSAFRMRERRS
jgi:hypothetical protein